MGRGFGSVRGKLVANPDGTLASIGWKPDNKEGGEEYSNVQ
jgi:hypothetical protein